MGKEYLVEGAMLMCVNGSSFNMLKIPIGHGYTSAGKKKANCRGGGKGGRGRGPDYGQRTPLQKRRRHHASDLGPGLRERDRQGQLLARKDRNGNTDTFSHNKKGQLIQVKGANGGELFYSYNREGKLISVRDHAGREICLRYRYGKLYQYVNPAGHAYTYAYNEDGKLESVTTPRKIVGVKNTYDGAGRVVKQEMPDGGRIELLYDDGNNRTYQKEPNGNLIVYESDERFRNVRTIYEDGEETRYSYDAMGNKTGNRKERSGRPEESGSYVYTYDALNRLERAWDNTGKEAEYFYNGLG